MGPTGEMMEPHGALTREEAEETFSEQAEALAEGGVDVLWIETIFAFAELEAAVAAATRTGLAFASTMTFDTAGRTMMGDTPEQAIEFVHGLTPRPIAFGANCGTGPATLLDTLRRFAGSAAADDVIVAKGNCGVPEMVEGEIRFRGDEKTMARYARMARDAGARIVGGCCGTTPVHLAAIAAALEGYTPGPMPEKIAIEKALGPIAAPKAGAERRQTQRRRNKR
jgi:5-methyltetrahydrofolate--homocysteine methyltransferase